MTTDGGGWTLVGTYPKTATGSKDRLCDYEAMPDITNNNPTVQGMYRGDVSMFSDAREQASGTTTSSCKKVYSLGLSDAEMDLIRTSLAYLDLADTLTGSTPLPNCTTT